MSHPTGPYRPGPDPRRPVPGARYPHPSPSAELRRDAQAAYAAGRELGPEYEDSIAAGLAERIEMLAAMRTAELRHEGSKEQWEHESERVAQRNRFTLGIISLGVGVPITAISATNVEPGLLGIAVAWAGIVGVNLACAWTGRRRR